MHTLMLKSKFVAQHFLIGKDYGEENHRHSHHYTLELEIAHKELDTYNYLIDIVDAKSVLDKLVGSFRDKTLNELPEFYEMNPSLELFSKILWSKFKEELSLPGGSKISVSLWEDDIARASYKENF